MKYQIGDKVLLLHSKEEATIIDFLDNQMVSVEVEGVHFPVFIDQIDFPYYYRFSPSQKKSTPEKPKIVKRSLDDLRVEKNKTDQPASAENLSFVLLPVLADTEDEWQVESFKLYLHNGLSHSVQFDYRVSVLGNVDWQFAGKVERGHNFYLHDFLMEGFNDNPIFLFEFSLVEKMKGKVDQFSHTIRIKPKQLFAQLQKLKESKEASFSFRIVDEYPDQNMFQILDTSEIGFKANNSIDSLKSSLFEKSFYHVIDLHIEELVANWKGLSNFEILSIQLNAFERQIELAIQHHQPTLTVIHGVGKGKLKEEIHQWLNGKPFIRSYSDQFDPFYGNGATTIHFQY